MEVFRHLDGFSNDEKIYWEEYERQLKTLENVSKMELEVNDFKRIKRYDRGFFEKHEFINWCIQNCKISVTARKEETMRLFKAKKA